MQFLVVQLFGPLAAWGAEGAREHRPVFATPSRSGVLGLVGAALGIERSNEDLLSRLSAGYGFASVTWTAGQVVDFHTVGNGSRKNVSYRTYQDQAWAAATLWAHPDAPYTLLEVASAIRQPAFPLALGRRSCAPALPLHPQVVEARDPIEALRTPFPSDENLDRYLRRRGPFRFTYEGHFDTIPTSEARTRRDLPSSRAQWLFLDRPEFVYTGPLRPEAP